MTNWIICPVRDNLKFTLDAMPTFLAQDIGNVRVLLVDNGRTDVTWKWWKTQSTSIDYVHNQPAKSVAVSWNQALRLAFETEDYALVVNNDVLLRPDTYRLLVEDGGGFVTAVGNNDPRCVRTQAAPSMPPRPHPDFSCYLIRKWVYEKVGPFDERFLNAFCEDWDYHCRMHQAGIEAYCIDLPFYHFGSATVKNTDPEMAAAIHEQAARNRDYFEQKWGFRGATPEYSDFFKKEPS